MKATYFKPGKVTALHDIPESSGLFPDRLIELTFDAMLDDDHELPDQYLLWVNAKYRRAVDVISINALIHPGSSGDYLDEDVVIAFLDPDTLIYGRNETVSEENWKSRMVVSGLTLDDFCRAALRFVEDVLGGVPCSEEEEN